MLTLFQNSDKPQPRSSLNLLGKYRQRCSNISFGIMMGVFVQCTNVSTNCFTGMHGTRTVSGLNISRWDVNFLIMSRRHKFGCAPAVPTLCSARSVSFAVPSEATTSATHADAMRCTTGADTTPHAHKCNTKETSTDDEVLIGSLNLRRFPLCFAAVPAIASSRFISYTCTCKMALA